MTKKIKKQEAKYHLGDIKMQFLTAMVSGVDKHLTSPKGSIMFSRLNDKKKNEKFRNHILDEFAKGSADALENINHEHVYGLAESHQKKFLAAAQKAVNKVEKQGENFDHHQLLSDAFSGFEKVHLQLLNKI